MFCYPDVLFGTVYFCFIPFSTSFLLFSYGSRGKMVMPTIFLLITSFFFLSLLFSLFALDVSRDVYYGCASFFFFLPFAFSFSLSLEVCTGRLAFMLSDFALLYHLGRLHSRTGTELYHLYRRIMAGLFNIFPI